MNTYLLFKSIHLIAVISWMAGLLYLPRLFVYHVEKKRNKEISKTFKTMEKRLMLYIMNPAMIFSWVFGVLLFLSNDSEIYFELWIKLKFLLVVLLTIYHFILGYYLSKLAKGNNKKSAKFFRIINEIPTVLLIFIIFVIIYKPL